MSARPRPTATAPKPPTNLLLCTVSDQAVLIGKELITVKEDSIIHPRARLESTHGRVYIGKNCMISERARVGLQGGSDDAGPQEGVMLDDLVTVGPNAVVEAAKVGRGTDIEAGARIGRGARIGEHCKIAALCTVSPGEEIPDRTVIFGDNQRRVERQGLEQLRTSTKLKEIEALKKLIPSNLAKWQT